MKVLILYTYLHTQNIIFLQVKIQLYWQEKKKERDAIFFADLLSFSSIYFASSYDDDDDV